MRRPLAYPLMALIAGILIGDLINLPCFLLLAGALPILTALLLSVRHKWTLAAFLLTFVLMFIVGLFNIQRQQYLASDDRHIIHQADQGQLTVEGIVLSIDQIDPASLSLVVRCRQMIKNDSYLPLTGNIRLVIPRDLSFQYGDFIRFHSRIKKIRSFHNPGGFSYERFLNRQGIYVSGFIASPAGIVLIRRNSASFLVMKVENYRLYLKHLIDANAPSPQREIIEAMTIGLQKTIPQDVRDNFAKTGTSHILSISGLHVGMVAAAGFFLIFLLLRSSEYLMLKFNTIKIATTAAFLPVVLYALIAGMGTTVLRATLMALAVLTALLIGKQKDLYNILFGAALIILIALPESLFEISFQLSFSAVFAILYMVPKLSDLPLPIPKSTPGWLHTLIRRIYIFILVSAAATLGTLPIIVFYFNRVSAVTLVANLIAVPLLGMLTLILAMASILTSIFSPVIAGLFIQAASFFTAISVAIINGLASLSWSAFNFTKPNVAEIVLFYIFLFLLMEMITPGDNHHEKKFPARHPLFIRTAFVISVALIFADAAYLNLKDQYSRNLKITAIDVGQGAATLVQLPHGVNMLIDGGGFQDSAFDMGRFVIAPFLYASRIRKIDIAVLTHPHPDHLQGLIYIINNFDVREVWCTGVKTNDLQDLWEKTISGRKIKIKRLSSQSPPENIRGVHLQFLWPLYPPDQNKAESSYHEINDASLVMKMTYGTRSFLVTGDISARVEALLIRSGQNVQSDLLFVPHHGSIHSSSMDFIRAVSCRFAIVSAGKYNVFRHPHPLVLDRYTSAGVEIFRTDQDGAIFVSSDGQSLKITPWLERPVPDGHP